MCYGNAFVLAFSMVGLDYDLEIKFKNFYRDFGYEYNSKTKKRYSFTRFMDERMASFLFQVLPYF